MLMILLNCRRSRCSHHLYSVAQLCLVCAVVTSVLQTQHAVLCGVGASFLVVVEQFRSNKEVDAARGALAVLEGEWARAVFCQWRGVV